MTDRDQTTEGWRVGQQAAIDRRRVVTVERVTPSGRAVIGLRCFDRDGMERTKAGADRWSRAKLEPLTDEIQAEVALVERARVAKSEATAAVVAADRFLRLALSMWDSRCPEAADVDVAERLAAAITQAMQDSHDR